MERELTYLDTYKLLHHSIRINHISYAGITDYESYRDFSSNLYFDPVNILGPHITDNHVC